MALRGIVFSFLALILTACSDSQGSEIEQLAESITQASKDQVYLRKIRAEAVDMEVVFLDRTAALTAELTTSNARSALDGIPRWIVTLRKWECPGDQVESCRRGKGLPVVYMIEEERVDPGSINVVRPGDAGGVETFGVQFKCSGFWDFDLQLSDPFATRECIRLHEVGGYGGYKPCSDRNCDAVEQEIEDGVRNFAESRAAQGWQSIGCPDEQTCEKIATDFRELIDRASDRQYIADIEAMQAAAASIGETARGAAFAEEAVDGGVTFTAGSMVGVADSVHHRGETVHIDPDGRLHVETRVCAGEEDIPCDGNGEWLKHILHAELGGLDPTSIMTLGDMRLTEDDIETVYDGRAVFAACRGGDERSCSAVAGADAFGFNIIFPCTDEERCKEAARALAGIASFAATPVFGAWRDEQKIAARKPTVIETRQGAEQAVERISEGLSDGPYRVYVSGMDTSFLMTPISATLNHNNRMMVSVSYCRKERAVYAPFDGAPCGPDPTALDAITTITLTGVDADAFETLESTSMSDGMVVRFDCTNERNCGSMPIAEGALESTEVFLSCVDPEGCAAMTRDLAGLASWARTAPTLKVAVKEDDKRESDSGSDGPDPVIEEMARLSKGVQFKTANRSSPGFVLVRTRDVTQTPDGRLQIGSEVCAYQYETTDDAFSYWNPENDSRRCDQPDGWLAVRYIFDPLSIDPDTVHVQSFGNNGAVRRGFTGNALGYAVSATCRFDVTCIESGGADSVVRISVPCRDENGCASMERAFKALTDPFRDSGTAGR